MPRLFFALWPDDAAKIALVPHAKRLAREGSGRPVPAAKLHLTLAFLGDVPDDRVEAARRCASGVGGEPFDLLLDRIGAFRQAGVVWAGPSALPGELAGLQAALEGALHAAGFDLDARPFAPHLTLARKVTRPAPPASIEPVGWRVRRFALVRSDTGEGAYANVADWELGKES